MRLLIENKNKRFYINNNQYILVCIIIYLTKQTREWLERIVEL